MTMGASKAPRWTYVSRVVGTDEATGFDVAVNNDGEAAFLSPCCGASAKGCDGYTGCRACYAPIDPRIGDLPPEEWWAPHQRHRVSSFNDFLLELFTKSLTPSASNLQKKGTTMTDKKPAIIVEVVDVNDPEALEYDRREAREEARVLREARAKERRRVVPAAPEAASLQDALRALRSRS